jgi:hypothetical protein
VTRKGHQLLLRLGPYIVYEIDLGTEYETFVRSYFCRISSNSVVAVAMYLLVVRFDCDRELASGANIRTRYINMHYLEVRN